MANRRGRPSHLDAPSVEEGLEMYLEVCGSSGLPNVQRIARSLRAMKPAKRLKVYQERFEDEAAWGEDQAALEAEVVDWDNDEAADLRAEIRRLENLLNSKGGGDNMAKTQTRSKSRRAAAADGFGVGTTFTYRNNNGEESEHTIVRVAGGRAYTDTDKRFKISTLEQLNGDVVNIVG